MEFLRELWIILAIFVYIVTVLCDSDKPELTDYIFIDEFQAFYKLYDAKNFKNALATCTAEMSELFLPMSEKEALDITSSINVGKDIIYLGMTDILEEGKFVTPDGKSIDSFYINWSPGEPTNSGGSENCVTTNPDLKYNDVPCELDYKFICKKKYLPRIKNESSGYEFFPSVDVLYKFHEDIKTWFEAREVCRHENATLAMPQTEKEVEIIKLIFKEHPASTLKHIKNYDYSFIGFHDIFKEGEYLTENGDSLEYYFNVWEDKQPDNSRPRENCGSLNREGKLNDLNCNTPGLFICQQKYVIKGPKTVYHYLESVNKSYKLHTTPKLWNDARSTCSTEGGNLAIINTKEEKDFLVKIFKAAKDQMKKDTFEFALMGFHDMFLEGKFVAVTGEDFNTIDLSWKGGDIKSDKNRNCGAITDDGELSDYSCSTPAIFFCEILGFENTYGTENVHGKQEYQYSHDLEIYFRVHKNPRKWNHARRLCLAENATLAIPKNKDEAEALLELFKIHSDDSVPHMHLGFHDLFTKWDYVTDLGDPLQYYYREWNAGQPDNDNNIEHCVSMGRNGKLNDISCDTETVFICQQRMKPFKNEHHKNCYSDDIGYEYEEHLHHGYKLHLNPQPWGVARSICAAEGGHLAIINSLEERDFLKRILNKLENRILHVKYPDNALIGFHDLFEESHFTTLSGEELQDAEFATWKKKPNYNIDRNCGCMTFAGKLDDFPCSEPAVFFCEISNWEYL